MPIFIRGTVELVARVASCQAAGPVGKQGLHWLVWRFPGLFRASWRPIPLRA
jgi:hypothetical protein